MPYVKQEFLEENIDNALFDDILWRATHPDIFTWGAFAVGGITCRYQSIQDWTDYYGIPKERVGPLIIDKWAMEWTHYELLYWDWAFGGPIGQPDMFYSIWRLRIPLRAR